MNPNDNNPYNPADDDNQGVVQLLAQAQEATTGIGQVGGINPVTAQGPEPVKEEVNDDPDSDGDSSLNTDELVEKAVDDETITVDGTHE